MERAILPHAPAAVTRSWYAGATAALFDVAAATHLSVTEDAMTGTIVLALSLLAQLGSGDTISSPIGATSGNTTSGGLGGMDRSDANLGDAHTGGGGDHMSTAPAPSTPSTAATGTAGIGTLGGGERSSEPAGSTGMTGASTTGTSAGTTSGTGIGGSTNSSGGMR